MPTNAHESYNPAGTVTCRPSNLYWVFVPFCAGFGVAAWFGAHSPSKAGPPPAADVLFVQICAVVLLLAAAALAAWVTRACIVADDSGLRWRRSGGWKSARWEDVQDYYDPLPTQRRRGSFVAVIRTAAGGLRFDGDWTNADALRERVAGRATEAAARRWDMLGTRPCDKWPRVFRYDTWQNIWTPRILLKLALSGFGYLLSKPLMPLVSQAGQIGWGLTLAVGATYILLIGAMALPLLLIFAQYHAAGKRRAERITVDTEGIVFEDGARRVGAQWADVTGYEIASGAGTLSARYVVETRRGDFDFLAALSGAILLMAIIQRYAQGAADKEWRARVDPEALGGEAARWSGGRVGVGARVYHYRTRMNRAMLGLPLGMCLTVAFVCWAASQGLMPGTGMAGPVCGAISLGLVFVGGCHAYRVCRIETDADGLTRITPLGRQRLAWDQVEDYFLTEGGGVVAGRGERLGFGSGIVGRDELKEEVARRAAACGGRLWERRATRTAPDGRRRGRTGPESSGPG